MTDAPDLSETLEDLKHIRAWLRKTWVDVDAVIKRLEPEPPKGKSRRRDISVEHRQKMRLSLAKARAVRMENLGGWME